MTPPKSHPSSCSFLPVFFPSNFPSPIRTVARMASRFSYQRLRQEVIFEDERVILGSRPSRFSWLGRLRRRRRRFKVKIAGLRRFFRIRRAKVSRISWSKIVKRLKESKSHWGDLFAGNYLFMQVAPASLSKNRLEKICVGLHHSSGNNDNKHRLPSGFPNTSRYIVA